MDTDTPTPTSSQEQTITRVFVSSLCKKIAKDLQLPKEVVYEVYRAIPLHMVAALKQKKAVVFENLGVFSPHIMNFTLRGEPPQDTYKIRFKASRKLKATMFELAINEDRQKISKKLK